MPVVEELPDDYVAKPTKASSSSSAPTASSSSATAEAPHSGTAGRAAAASGLRKGFFSTGASSGRSNQQRPAEDSTRRVVPVAELLQAQPSVADTKPHSSSGAKASIVADMEELEELEEFDEDDEAVDAEDAGEFGESPAELVEGLRRRLRSSADGGDSGVRASLEKVTRDLEDIVQSVNSQAKLPAGHVRSSRERALAEADAALADMRATSNDARRFRASDEKRVAADLKRAAEDALERVRKVAELAAPPKGDDGASAEERSRRAVDGFHKLPIAAKFRLLAGERVATVTLLLCFAAGMGLVFAGFAEVYSAWGCGLRCGT